MKLLLDTHALIWAMDDPSCLSPLAAISLRDPANELLLSAATVWEIAIKIGQGKLKLSLPYYDWMNKSVTDLALVILPVTVEYADVQSRLPLHHKDPFDRLIIAQAITLGVSVVGMDAILHSYGLTRVW